MDFQQLYEETKHLNILFVEDYEELRTNTLEILENYFYYCEGAENGRKGLEQYKAYHDREKRYFDVVITDIKMPEMDGISLVEEIYNLHPDQAIIVLSAHNEVDYLLTLINLGIEQFITKPIDHDHMLNVLYNVSQKISHSSKQEESDKIILDAKTYYDKRQNLFYHDNEIVKLTRNESVFMKLLASNGEKISTIEEILYTFDYEDIFISRENIRTLVAKLRKKLPINCVESIYAVGYKLMIPAKQ